MRSESYRPRLGGYNKSRPCVAGEGHCCSRYCAFYRRLGYFSDFFRFSVRTTIHPRPPRVHTYKVIVVRKIALFIGVWGIFRIFLDSLYVPPPPPPTQGTYVQGHCCVTCCAFYRRLGYFSDFFELSLPFMDDCISR